MWVTNRNGRAGRFPEGMTTGRMASRHLRDGQDKKVIGGEINTLRDWGHDGNQWGAWRPQGRPASSHSPHKAECGSPCLPWGTTCCYCTEEEVRGQPLSKYLFPFRTCFPFSPFLAESNTHEARLIGPIWFHSDELPVKPSALAPPRYRSCEGSGQVTAPKRGGAAHGYKWPCAPHSLSLGWADCFP